MIRLFPGLCLLLLPLAVLPAGCSGDGAPADPMPDLAQVVSQMCARETRADHYAAGMEKAGKMGALRVRLLSSQPGPPEIGINTWTAEVLDAAGAPVSGAAFTVKPWMPDHGHGTSVKAAASPAATDGTYTITPLYLFMAGLWQVTLDIQSPSGAGDTAVFSFCLSDN